MQTPEGPSVWMRIAAGLASSGLPHAQLSEGRILACASPAREVPAANAPRMGWGLRCGRTFGWTEA